MLNTIYQPQEIEKKIYQMWEENAYFSPDKPDSASFSLVLPPPNVTGALHMGHALNLTLQDIIVRYQKMKGLNVLWIPGTDHAGIATQNVVEKKLEREGTNRHQLGRSAFVDKVWEWKKEYGSRITTQMRRMGSAIDWQHERFTMDEGSSSAVLETFINLFNDGLIYQDRYIINWCPRCKTALSDIEVDHHDKNGHLWYILYPFSSGCRGGSPAGVEGSEPFYKNRGKDPGIIVATTRPETMFGDTAIAVNPNDERYAKFIGKYVKIPFTETEIPVIADEMVETSFGTGAVKITPAHDFNDFAAGKRHNLAQVIVIDENGHMNENAPQEFQGLDRFTCRKHLIEKLTETNLLVKTEDHALSIAHCYRCHTIIEPYISKQWFIKMKPLAEKAIEVVKNKQIEFVPERWEKVYFDWMENIRDWCISRQIWWGHQIPVWYCPNHADKPIAGKTKPQACPICNNQELVQDPDVLDTWFSSALWPFSTLGWPQKTEDLAKFYPTSLLVTAYDILTFWVSRMIVMGLKNLNQIPFEKVYIHGLIRDITGKKMSKSSGNALDPIELIEESGADALRFALASLTTLGGQDIKMAKEKIMATRNFMNKIWNAARFVMMGIEEQCIRQKAKGTRENSELEAPSGFKGRSSLENQSLPSGAGGEAPCKDLAISWLLSCFQELLIDYDRLLNDFNYGLLTEKLWDFTWNKYCDWFIEISKMDKEKYLPVLTEMLINLLKILHPFIPFITEEIWQNLFELENIKELKSARACIISDWPKYQPELIDKKSQEKMELIIQVIREIRNLRKELNLSPKIEIAVNFITNNQKQIEILEEGKEFIEKMAKVGNKYICSDSAEQISPSAKTVSSIVEGIEIQIPLEGLIDLDKEKARIETQITKINQDLEILEKQLNNKEFLAKAPKAVVEKITNNYEKLKTEKEILLAKI